MHFRATESMSRGTAVRLWKNTTDFSICPASNLPMAGDKFEDRKEINGYLGILSCDVEEGALVTPTNIIGLGTVMEDVLPVDIPSQNIIYLGRNGKLTNFAPVGVSGTHRMVVGVSLGNGHLAVRHNYLGKIH